MSKTPIALFIAMAALALVGCGGGGNASTTSGASQPSTTTSTTSQPSTTTSTQKPKQSSAPASGVPLSKGGDNSIQTYGLEASDSERTAAANTAQAFFNARLAGNWAAACADLAAPIKQQLEALLSQAKAAKTKGCSAALRAISGSVPKSNLRIAADIQVLSLRVKGPQAFLIYRDGTGTPSEIPMIREGGTWRVGSATGNPLPL